MAKFLQALTEAGTPRERRRPARGHNPFPGLRPFREDEEHLFFGRENQVDAMVDKLAVTRFLAVVGTSGSGKSSLVNCGLRPALRQGLMSRAGTAGAWRSSDPAVIRSPRWLEPWRRTACCFPTTRRKVRRWPRSSIPPSV